MTEREPDVRARWRALAAITLAIALAGPAAADAATVTVDSGSLTAIAEDDPWRLRFQGPEGLRLAESALGGNARPGSLGFQTELGWVHATRATALERVGDAVVARVATSDPLGRTITVRIAPAGEGAIA